MKLPRTECIHREVGCCSCFGLIFNVSRWLEMVTFVHLFMPNNPKGSEWTKEIHQINLKSHSGPTNALLINKESSSSKPVVFPVPLPETTSRSLPLSPHPSASTQVQHGRSEPAWANCLWTKPDSSAYAGHRLVFRWVPESLLQVEVL